jgi:putative restriction endonuclease
MPALRKTSGHLKNEIAVALESNPVLLAKVTKLLLDQYFPEALHEEIADAVGLCIPEATVAFAPEYSTRRRDPAFRDKVLMAYEYRCAVTGFRVALSGIYFGCEAAHVRWHAYEGPDVVNNGIALEPTMHKLFDSGAWSLTDDRRILVSAQLTGSDETIKSLRALHGKPMSAPVMAQDSVDSSYIRWHREPGLGGVFRTPALA